MYNAVIDCISSLTIEDNIDNLDMKSLNCMQAAEIVCFLLSKQELIESNYKQGSDQHNADSLYFFVFSNYN